MDAGREARISGKVRCFDRINRSENLISLSPPMKRCVLEAETRVFILGEPIMVRDLDGELLNMIKIRHEDCDGRLHEGWVAVAALDLTSISAG